MISTNADRPAPANPQIIIHAAAEADRHEIEAILRESSCAENLRLTANPAELARFLALPHAPDLAIVAADGINLQALLFDIRSRAPFTPIIVISRQTETEQVVSCLLSGASDYLTWPRLNRLPERIQYFINERNSHGSASTGIDPHFKGLIDAYPSPGWLTDQTGAFVYFNKAWLDFTGTNASSSFGDGWREQLFDEDKKRFAHKFSGALKRHQHFSIDFRLRRADGAYRWVHAQGTPHHNIHGHFTGYVGSCVDINDQHETETLLVYRVITQAALAGFGRFALTHQPFHQLKQEATRLICDTLQLQQSEVLIIEGGELQRCASTGFLDTVGHTQMVAPPLDQLDGQPLLLEYDHAIFPGRETHAQLGIKTAIAAPINGGKTLFGFLTGLSARSQELGREAIDFIQAVANILSTVHQRKEAEAALEESEQKLLQSQKMEAVGLLAGGVAHDFNNLLTAVRCYGEMLNEDLAEVAPDLQSKVGEILKASARASALTRQLLTFSRKQVLQPEILDLNAVVTDLKDLVRSLLSENVTLHVDLLAGNTSCEVDRNQLDQIILNLCLNARDAMSNGGRLTLRVGTREIFPANSQGLAAGEYLELQVSDTGSGMSPDIQAKLFQPFFTTKAPGHGTGLGLATCAVIAKNFNGTITFTSELDVGTCFSVFIPMASPFARQSSVIEEGPAGGGDEHILIVEDDDAVRHVATLILTNLGYKVTVFPGSMEALNYFKENENLVPMFDLLLSDMVMPFMNGRNLAKEICALQPGIKVLFMSGYVGDADILADMQDSDLPFLEKPFTRSTLARKVRETLG